MRDPTGSLLLPLQRWPACFWLRAWWACNAASVARPWWATAWHDTIPPVLVRPRTSHGEQDNPESNRTTPASRHSTAHGKQEPCVHPINTLSQFANSAFPSVSFCTCPSPPSAGILSSRGAGRAKSFLPSSSRHRLMDSASVSPAHTDRHTKFQPRSS